MPGPEPPPKAFSLPGSLTKAGRIVDQHATGRLGRVPSSPAPTTVRPTNARVRAARQQAAQGVRFAQEGRIGPAIERLKQAIALDPTIATVHHDLGLALLQAARLEDAVNSLANAVRLDPDLLNAHLRLATVLDTLGREAEAQTVYETIVRLDPSQHLAHARLGQIHLANGWPARAASAFLAAAEAAASLASSRVRIYQAHAAIVSGQLAEAEALVRGVIADDPTCGEAHVTLGQILAENGQSSDAAASFERGIAEDPSLVAAWYPFSTSKKFTVGDMGLIERISACLQRPDLTQAQLQSVHFALGKAYDDIGDYTPAMHHLDAANRIRGAHRRLDRARLARQTAHVISATPPGFLARRPDLGVDDATPILIVGMPRSGTTLVEQILSSHPEVAAGGELTFWRGRNRAGLGVFGPDAEPETVRRLADDYLKVLRAISPTAARVTDKMPFNFAHLGVIRQVFPRATFVHCRRNPIDTCLSIFATNFLIPYDFAGDRGSLVFFYREYQRLMAHWREVLPAERFIEVDYEALVAEPEPITRQLIATCGLEWNDACLRPDKNRRSIATASLWQARQPIYRTSVERWRRYEPWLGELRDLLTHAELANPRSPG